MPQRTPHPIRRRDPLARLGLAVLTAWLLLPGLGAGSELRETPIVRAVKSARPSVVNIRGEKTVEGLGAKVDEIEAGRRVNGMGTGVVIDSRGYILTNYHVVDGVRQIQVTPADGKMLPGRLIARDSETDLAVIKIDPPDPLPVIAIGTSSDLMPGEPVVAVGNAYGYEHTVTRGIISALHRAVQVSDAQYYDDLIQTDASINPGNSGGPLLNIDGEMIGLNVAVRAGAQGIGFAIPVDKAMAMAAKLFASRAARSAWHGVELGAGVAGKQQGSTIAAIEQKSPAAAAGLRVGDVITAVDDIDVRRDLDFYRAMLQRGAGDDVKLAIRRCGDPMTVRLTLADLPHPKRSNRPAWLLLGLDLEPIPGEEFRSKYQTRYRGGLTIKAVRPGSPAAKQGIRPGDVLVGMHIWETISLENVSYILARPDFAALNPIKFFILRKKETLYGYLPVAMKTAKR